MMTYTTKNNSELIAVDLVSNAGVDHLEDDNVGVDKFDRSSHNGCWRLTGSVPGVKSGKHCVPKAYENLC